ncbi:MAG: glycosyltransferase family 1 protein [Polyangiales bacterium]
MIVGIDASNLRAGGGVTHLREILGAASPGRFGFRKVIVWCGAETAAQLPARPWLEVGHEPLLDGPLPSRVLWQQAVLRRKAPRSCDVLLVPGGNAQVPFRPRVVMSRNMLPFDRIERRRYGASWTGARLLALRQLQARSLSRADGVIFLTEFAFQSIRPALGARAPRRTSIIPHGVDARFRADPRPQRALSACGADDPLRLTYVSVVAPYKHQWVVAEAVARLRREGLPLSIDFVGGLEDSVSAERLRAAVRRLDPDGEFLRLRGAVRFQEVHEFYLRSELFVFASSCENMPNILLEAMAAGLPIACSDRGPMPEVLDDAGVYFDPEDADDTARALRALASDHELRARCAALASERASSFSWRRCADETFAFLAELARRPAAEA